MSHRIYSWISMQALGFACAIAASVSCGRRVDPELTHSRGTASAALAVTTPAVVSAGAVKPEQNEQESCGVDHTAPVRDSGERVAKDPKTGREVIRVGQAIDQAAERVSVAKAMQEPERFVGKTLQIEGDVTAMCTHRRGWYAMVDESSKLPLRIIAVPNFLVPANARGKRSRTSGVLEISEVSAQAATHLSRDHGLPESRRIVTLRATGAEFM